MHKNLTKIVYAAIKYVFVLLSQYDHAYSLYVTPVACTDTAMRKMTRQDGTGQRALYSPKVKFMPVKAIRTLETSY